MRQEEEITQLKKQLSELVERLSEVVEQLKAQERESHLLAQVSAVQAENQALHEQLAVAHTRIEELEKQKTPPPPFVKANVKKPPEEQKPQRKKRAPKHNHGRRREAPTCRVDHLIKHSPVCSSALGGISVGRRRQVIELPPPPAVEVTEHVVYHGWCSQCATWREAPLDVSQQVVGQGRFGVWIASLIAYLRTVMRLPVRQIQAYLAQGEIATAEEIQRTFEAEVKHEVHITSIYRLLDRHGWRKLVPRPRHPKANPAEQAAFKKTLRRRFKQHWPHAMLRTEDPC